MSQSKKHRDSELWTGVLLIALGVFFLLGTKDVIDVGSLIFDWWPLILVGLGFNELRGNDRSGGLTLIVIGLVFLAITHDIFEWSMLFEYWPVILIIIGVVMLFENRRSEVESDTPPPEKQAGAQ